MSNNNCATQNDILVFLVKKHEQQTLEHQWVVGPWGVEDPTPLTKTFSL